ncbi:hypothetical protein LX36DRAFT_750946 [Colletotrichum falcatum]|nr:hypothetical protein LX36DRAFT_750946 [Colletotrichum falcatum]
MPSSPLLDRPPQAPDEWLITIPKDDEVGQAPRPPSSLKRFIKIPEYGEYYEINAITGHRVDPHDPARLLMRCEWADGDPTWEPEEHLQVDVPEMWRSYIEAHNPRKVLGKKRDYWIILEIKSHSTVAEGVVNMQVSWVGSVEVTTETEAYLEAHHGDRLVKYWDSLGGRKAALAQEDWDRYMTKQEKRESVTDVTRL